MKAKIVDWVKQNWILSMIIGAILVLWLNYGLGYLMGVIDFYRQHP